MKILAIETSCDETACAVVENGRKVLANVIASQVDLHAKTGGVVPEVAAREHVLKMLPVLDHCLTETFGVSGGAAWKQVDALAITKGPGLVSSLIIGTETASVISYVKEKPLIPVQHIVGHIYSNWLFTKDAEQEPEPQFPLLILTVSGGHNELILMKDHHHFEVLGETRDDAAGEAFDKVARILGLGYPGGPAISKIAEKGNAGAFKLPRIFLEKDSLDFSFSGLKTAVLNEVKSYASNNDDLGEQFKADIAAEFQEAVVDVLVEKVLRVLTKYPELKEVHLAGGVSANLRLREALALAIQNFSPGITFRHPKSFGFCTDNAAMIAGAAYFQYQLSPDKYQPKSNVIPELSFEFENYYN